MSAGGAASGGPSSMRTALLIRSILDRLRRLENKRQPVPGAWRLETNLAGDLIAVNSTTGASHIVASATP